MDALRRATLGVTLPAVYDDYAAQLFDFHHSMLVDEVRTTSFLRAIAQQVQPGDVVVDIGAGTGVLSLFAVLAGAGKVYAIEQGPMAEVAGEIVKRNDLGDRIEIINEWSYEATLPERADVLVTETIGNIGFEEGILAWVTDARKRLLKPGARIVPSAISMMVAATESSHDYAEIGRLRRPLYEFDFTPLADLASHTMLWTDFSPVSLVTRPATVVDIDLSTTRQVDIEGTVTLRARRDALVHGLGCWFVAEIAPGISISNEPPTKAPSWNQGFLPLPEPVSVSKGDLLPVEIRSDGDGARWGWSLGVGEPAELTWTQPTAPPGPAPRVAY